MASLEKVAFNLWRKSSVEKLVVIEVARGALQSRDSSSSSRIEVRAELVFELIGESNSLDGDDEFVVDDCTSEGGSGAAVADEARLPKSSLVCVVSSGFFFFGFE